ncbi:MAG TPA: hypothetical protein VK978_03745 [Candidatus Saccharimonadales bacterium]|nr:hypothetical protein [Candidatus Saccharimonadales bacterium]
MTGEIGYPVRTEYEQIGIKDLDEEQLFQAILTAGEAWTEDERARVVAAYDLARYAHRDDKHRDLPYTYHLLRNANRITQYLHLTNPDLIIGIILHDAVEDHPEDVIRYDPAAESGYHMQMQVPENPIEKQRLAFENIGRRFSYRASRLVAGMTNPPPGPGPRPPRGERLRIYVSHVAVEIEDPDVFFLKWSDWADNGLGIVHSSEDLEPEREEGFKEKYGLVMPVLEARFYRPDIQAILDAVARENVMRSFELAHERLIIPVAAGSLAISGEHLDRTRQAAN